MTKHTDSDNNNNKKQQPDSFLKWDKYCGVNDLPLIVAHMEERWKVGRLDCYLRAFEVRPRWLQAGLMNKNSMAFTTML